MTLKFCFFGLMYCFGGLSWLAAQEAFTVLSTSASSGIEYIDEQGERSRVFAGLSLPTDGRLKVETGRSLQMIYAGRKIEVVGPREEKISVLRMEADALKSSTFLGRFWKFISSSVTNTGNAKDVENYHRRYLTNTRAGIKGYAADDDEIWLPAYLEGAMSSAEVFLHWEPIPGATYHLEVDNPDHDIPVLTAQVKSNHFVLPLARLAIQEGKTYAFTISAIQGERIVRTPTRYFSYQPEAATDLWNFLSKKRVTKQMTEFEKKLYFAQQLEAKELLEPTRQHYQILLEAAPNNKLIKKMYAAFLLRMNDTEKANALLSVN